MIKHRCIKCGHMMELTEIEDRNYNNGMYGISCCRCEHEWLMMDIIEVT